MVVRVECFLVGGGIVVRFRHACYEKTDFNVLTFGAIEVGV